MLDIPAGPDPCLVEVEVSGQISEQRLQGGPGGLGRGVVGTQGGVWLPQDLLGGFPAKAYL